MIPLPSKLRNLRPCLLLRLCLFPLIAALCFTPAAQAHVGSKDVFEQVSAGPYQLFVTIRPPNVIPGVATVEVRTSGGVVQAMEITPIPLTGEASKHPPAPDSMQRSTVDPAFFTGSLWLMAQGSWQVRFALDGAAGKATASVPVPAIPLSILPLSLPLALLLGFLGVTLVLGVGGIVAAAVREARLDPGLEATPTRRGRALLASRIALALAILAVAGGGYWWHTEAAAYALGLYQPLALTPTIVLTPGAATLDLDVASYDPVDGASTSRSASRARRNDDLLADHGHLMHLYAIHEPGMDAAFHLHPTLVSAGHLRIGLPSAMPPGTYKLYADIVHANGFPETLTATLNVPPNLPSTPLASEDASAMPPALTQGDLGPVYKIPDGYSMVWDRPVALTAGTAYAFRFQLLDAQGHPAGDMRSYLGMAGHAAFVKADGTTFAHTHPEGSAAMPAVMLANEANTEDSLGPMPGMDMATSDSALPSPIATPPPIPSTVDFPYGFPSPGRYRIFIQMKHGSTVETGVFDAEVR